MEALPCVYTLHVYVMWTHPSPDPTPRQALPEQVRPVVVAERADVRLPSRQAMFPTLMYSNITDFPVANRENMLFIPSDRGDAVDISRVPTFCKLR